RSTTSIATAIRRPFVMPGPSRHPAHRTLFDRIPLVAARPFPDPRLLAVAASIVSATSCQTNPWTVYGSVRRP
ncbi:hypothetical protein NYZ35_19505, partial [Acinetobacter baumannii]|nr:hypothetical protein [Acinetobacter baumannii]